jgi:hypothetical protein
MIMVYYIRKLKQRTVNFESMTLTDYANFEKSIADGTVKAYIVGITVSLF